MINIVGAGLCSAQNKTHIQNKYRFIGIVDTYGRMYQQKGRRKSPPLTTQLSLCYFLK